MFKVKKRYVFFDFQSVDSLYEIAQNKLRRTDSFAEISKFTELAKICKCFDKYFIKVTYR